MVLGIPMEVEIQSDSSTANSVPDRFGAGQRPKHIDTRYFWIQERVQDGDLSIKKVPSAKTAQMLERRQSLLQHYNYIAVCRIGILLTMDPALHYKMTVTSRCPVKGCSPDVDTETRRHEHRNRSEAKSLLLLNRVFRVETDQIGQYLDIEPDLRHAPLIISESGCSANTKTVSTPREKLQDKLVLDGRRSPNLNREDATRYRSACMRLFYSAQDPPKE